MSIVNKLKVLHSNYVFATDEDLPIKLMLLYSL